MIQHPFTTPKPTMNMQPWPKAKEKYSIWLSLTPFARHLSLLSILPYPPLVQRIELGFLDVLDVLITAFNSHQHSILHSWLPLPLLDDPPSPWLLFPPYPSCEWKVHHQYWASCCWKSKKEHDDLRSCRGFQLWFQ